MTLFIKRIREKGFLLSSGRNLTKDEPIILVLFPVSEVLQRTRCISRCFCITKNKFWVTDWPLTKTIVEKCGLVYAAEDVMYLQRHRASLTADVKRKLWQSAIKKSEVEKISGIGLAFEELKTVYSRLGNEGIAIPEQLPSSSAMIAITTSDHHGSNFGCNNQVLRRKQ